MKKLIKQWLFGDDIPHKHAPSNQADLLQQELSNRLQMRRKVTTTVVCLLVLTFSLCIILILLDGFRIGGFKLGDSTSKGLFGAFLAEVGLYGWIVRGVWK